MPTDGKKKILIVEDDVLIAMDLALIVEEAGGAVIGPFHTVDAALEGLNSDRLDLAILDFNLGPSTSERIAARLAEMDVPTAFLTGHASHHVTGHVPSATVIEKPVSQQKIARLLQTL